MISIDLTININCLCWQMIVIDCNTLANRLLCWYLDSCPIFITFLCHNRVIVYVATMLICDLFLIIIVKLCRTFIHCCTSLVLFSDLDPVVKITECTALLIKMDTCLIQASKVKSAAGQVVARYNVLHKSIIMLCYYRYL